MIDQNGAVVLVNSDSVYTNIQQVSHQPISLFAYQRPTELKDRSVELLVVFFESGLILTCFEFYKGNRESFFLRV